MFPLSMRPLPVLLALLMLSAARGQVCDPSGNLFLLSNYDGGIVTINVQTPKYLSPEPN